MYEVSNQCTRECLDYILILFPLDEIPTGIRPVPREADEEGLSGGASEEEGRAPRPGGDLTGENWDKPMVGTGGTGEMLDEGLPRVERCSSMSLLRREASTGRLSGLSGGAFKSFNEEEL